MEPLNYCRQVVMQFREQLKIPGLESWARARLEQAIDLARCSQKFLLPDEGRLFDDPDLRGLSELEELRLPHPFVALEFSVLDAHAPARKHIIFARERDDEIAFSAVRLFVHNGHWSYLTEASIPRRGWAERSSDGGIDSLALSPDGISDDDPTPWFQYHDVLLDFLNALACRNVETGLLSRRRPARKPKAALAFDDYHVLTLTPRGRGRASSGAVEGPRRSPREHLRRGHIRRHPSGPVWINAAVVNAGQGGRVMKDYRLFKGGPQP